MELLAKEDFRTLIKGLKAFYPQEQFIPDADAMAVWYRLLNDIPYNVLSAAINMHVTTNKFPPTVAELRVASARLMQTKNEISDLEAWAMVRRAVSRSTYYADEEFEKFPELIKKSVGASSNLREWAQVPIDTLDTVIQSQFLRSYRGMVARELELQKLRPEIRDRLEMIARNVLPERKGE